MTEIYVIVIFGAKRHNISIEENKNLEELSRKIEQVSQVATSRQKLIFKGKKLEKGDAILKTLGLTNNSKVMLISKEANLESGGDVKMTLEAVGEEVARIDEAFKNVNQQLTEDNEKDVMRRLEAVVEEYTKQLEFLDSLTLSDSEPQNKNKRKTLVNKILTSLQSCDYMLHTFKSYH